LKNCTHEQLMLLYSSIAKIQSWIV
jgi:hypothetical protein